MKKVVKVVMAITIMLMATNVTIAQQGQRQGKGYGMGSGQGNGFMMQGLNLTEDQQTQMQAMRLKGQKEMLPLSNQLGENRAKMQTLSTVENVDMKAINKLIDESSNLRASMAKMRMANHQEMRKILTDDQRIMFDSKGMRRGGKGGGNGQGCRKMGSKKMPGQKGMPRTGK